MSSLRQPLRGAWFWSKASGGPCGKPFLAEKLERQFAVRALLAETCGTEARLTIKHPTSKHSNATRGVVEHHTLWGRTGKHQSSKQ